MLRGLSAAVPIHMRKTFVAMLVIVLAAAAPVAAYHRKTPTLLQITLFGAGSVANARWAGFRYVVFDSDADLLGNGSTGRHVYMFDLQQRDRTGALALTQMTTGAGDSQHGSSGSRGKAIAYDVQPGGVGPRQIRLVKRIGGADWALTNGSGDSINPSMDDGGRYVAFQSTADLLGQGYTGWQIYLADLRVADPSCPFPCAATNNAGLRQITHKNGNSANAVVSKAGKVVAFESTADLLNAGENETQIYRTDMKLGTTIRVSHGPGESRRPSLSKNGAFLAFESDADLLGNGAGGTQVYLYKHGAGLQAVTATPGGNSTRPSLETNGRGVLFSSTDDLLNNGSTGPQIFEFGVSTGALRQVTAAPGTTRDPAYSAGVFTIFVADGDLLGNGSSGEQLYLVNLFSLNGSVP
jgi:Tol biopolymer transport system component